MKKMLLALMMVGLMGVGGEVLGWQTVRIDNLKKKEITKKIKEAAQKRYKLKEDEGLEIDFSGTDAAWEHVGRFLQFNYNIFSINLSNCSKIDGDAVVNILKNFTRLKHLDISRCSKLEELTVFEKIANGLGKLRLFNPTKLKLSDEERGILNISYLPKTGDPLLTIRISQTEFARRQDLTLRQDAKELEMSQNAFYDLHYKLRHGTSGWKEDRKDDALLIHNIITKVNREIDKRRELLDSYDLTKNIAKLEVQSKEEIAKAHKLGVYSEKIQRQIMHRRFKILKQITELKNKFQRDNGDLIVKLTKPIKPGIKELDLQSILFDPIGIENIEKILESNTNLSEANFRIEAKHIGKVSEVIVKKYEPDARGYHLKIAPSPTNTEPTRHSFSFFNERGRQRITCEMPVIEKDAEGMKKALILLNAEKTNLPIKSLTIMPDSYPVPIESITDNLKDLEKLYLTNVPKDLTNSFGFLLTSKLKNLSVLKMTLPKDFLDGDEGLIKQWFLMFGNQTEKHKVSSVISVPGVGDTDLLKDLGKLAGDRGAVINTPPSTDFRDKFK